MPAAILYPRFDHPAIEERYASWQAQLLLQRSGGDIHFYDQDEPARDSVVDVEADHVLVVTDPLVLVGPGLAASLTAVLDESGAFAAVPVTNEAAASGQRRTPRPYMTLRELEAVIAEFRKGDAEPERVTWQDADPGAFLIRTHTLADTTSTLCRVLEGKQVIISKADFVHRWASMRGQVREDLLSRIGMTAKSILEFGCGEGALGAAVKARQNCRVVGIEIDKRAVSLARQRLDDVYCGDVNEIVSILKERFDCIVGGDIVEHLADPWTFLADLRRLAAPGGFLLLSLPNLANASVVGDLLSGRFDYVYMGLTCAGHVRFFTRKTIEDMLAIAGWEAVAIEPQELAATKERDELLARLDSAGIPYSREDLLRSGFYVIARNPA